MAILFWRRSHECCLTKPLHPINLPPMNASAHKQHGWWSLQAGRGLWLPSLLLIAGMATAAPAGTVTEQMTRAGQLASSNHWDKAAAAYGAIWDQYRQQAEGQEARFRQGQCLASAEKYAEAIACWESLQGALGATEWKEAALLETARTQSFKIGDLDAGLAAFQQYLGRYPQSARRWEAEYQLAGVWFTKGDHARAKTQFAKFLAAHPDAPVADKAKEYLAQCEAALRAAAEAAKRKPTTPPPSTKPTASQQLLRQADAARKREKYTDAITDYQRLLFSHRNTPEYDLAVLGAARCHVELENPKKAVELVEELLRTKPASTNAPAALLLLGELQLEELDQPAAAEATYERLLREHPNGDLTSPARFGLGLALFQQELWGKAKEQFLAEQKARGGPNSERPPTGLDLMIKACNARRPLTPDRQRGLSKLYRQLSTADMLFTAQSYE